MITLSSAISPAGDEVYVAFSNLVFMLNFFKSKKPLDSGNEIISICVFLMGLSHMTMLLLVFVPMNVTKQALVVGKGPVLRQQPAIQSETMSKDLLEHVLENSGIVELYASGRISALGNEWGLKGI